MYQNIRPCHGKGKFDKITQKANMTLQLPKEGLSYIIPHAKQLCPLTVTSPIVTQAIHNIAHRHITPCMMIMETSSCTSPPQYEKEWCKEKSKQSTTNSIQLGQLVSTVLDKS
jgi:hypothetical protein